MFLSVIELGLALAALGPTGLALVVLVEALSAAFAPRTRRSPAKERPRIAVVMPAHDEAANIRPAIESVQKALLPTDRLLVVADNCSDDTASVARALGAEVVERFDADRRGKGYALAFGFDALASSPPDVAIVVDADCLVGKQALGRIGRLAHELERPVQALYLMRSPAGAGLKTRLAEFAWRMKNYVRPEGARRLGVSCQLMGTGMAFPWDIIEEADFASGHLVEDMELGVELALAGRAPEFCSDALVTSEFPTVQAGAESQRTRWEHGHLTMIKSHVPRLVVEGLRRGDLRLLGFALDLAVPPLAALVLLLLASAVATATLVPFGRTLAFEVALLGLLALTASVLLAWQTAGRRVVALGELLGVPLYVLRKVPLYLKLFRKKQSTWVRTARGDGSTH